MVKQKNKTGWVIRNIKTGRYAAGKGRYITTTKLTNAAIYKTRNEARKDRFVGQETVNKVAFNDTEIEVIGGNGTGCRI